MSVLCQCTYFANPLGIGTENPSTLLEVEGTNTGGILTLSNSNTGISENDVLGAVQFRNYDTSLNFAGVVAELRAIAGAPYGGSGAKPASDLVFLTNDDSTPPNPVERLRVTADGKIGIGTANPGLDLDLRKTKSGAAVEARIRNDGTGANSHALLDLAIVGAAPSVPAVRFDYNTAYLWGIGVDTNDGNKLKFYNNRTTYLPGAGDLLTLVADPVTGTRRVVLSGTSPWADVLGYGADPTNVLDSTTAFQTAIDAVRDAGGGTVAIPAGTYKITRSLVIPSKVQLLGFGYASVIFYLPTGFTVSTGTLTSTSGTTVNGSGFNALQAGYAISAAGQTHIVQTVNSDTQLMTYTAFSPAIPGGSNAPYTYVPSSPGTVSSSSTTVTGAGGTNFGTIKPGDALTAAGQTQIVASVNAAAQTLTTVRPFSPGLPAGTRYTTYPGPALLVHNRQSVVISSLRLDGNAGTNPVLPAQDLIQFSGTPANTTFLVLNCQLGNTRYKAIEINGGSGYRIVNCNFDNCANAAVQADAGFDGTNTVPANDIYLECCIGNNGARDKQGTGLLVQDTDAILMVRSAFLNYYYGIDFNPKTANVYRAHFIVASSFDSCSYGAYVGRNNGAVAFGIMFQGCWFGTCITGLVSETASGLRIVGSTIANNSTHGILLAGEATNPTKGVVIDGCVITGNGYFGTEPTYSGIKIAGSATDIVINSGRIGAVAQFTAIQKYGIDIDSGTRVFIITSNHLLGNATKGLNDASSGTQRIKANNLGEDTP